MKSTILGLIQFVSMLSTSFAQTVIVPASGIKVSSGGKTFYENSTIIKDQCNGFYKNYKATLHQKLSDAIINSIHEATGEHVRELNIDLTDQIEVLAENTFLKEDGSSGSFSYIIKITNNKADFKITTPDLPIINTGFDRKMDPHFEIVCDLSIRTTYFNALKPEDFTVFSSKIILDNYKINAINDPAKGVKLFNKVYSIFNKGKGFIPQLEKDQGSLKDLLNTRLSPILQALLKTPALLEEYQFDGNDKLLVLINEQNGMLEINHPATMQGIVQRKKRVDLNMDKVNNDKTHYADRSKLRPQEKLKQTDLDNDKRYSSPQLKKIPNYHVRPVVVKPGPSPKNVTVNNQNPQLNPQPLPPDDKSANRKVKPVINKVNKKSKTAQPVIK